jgi:hypothetical protein
VIAVVAPPYPAARLGSVTLTEDLTMQPVRADRWVDILHGIDQAKSIGYRLLPDATLTW